MLKLYSAPRTRSLRVAWLLEEMGVEYDLIHGEFTRTRDRFFIQSTPTGKYPTIDDDGFIMFESGAILEYLIGKYSNTDLAPPTDSPSRGEYLQWMYFSDATAFAPLGIVIWLAVYRDDAAQHGELIEDARNRAQSGFTVLENQLTDRNWLLAQGFSAADIMMGFTIMAASLLNMIEPDSALDRYLKRLQARPALAVALERCGGF